MPRGRTGGRRTSSPAELLSRIRALTHALRGGPEDPVERARSLLAAAMATRLPCEIAVVLGAAAELRIFPEPADLERCQALLQRSDDVTARAAVWVVRHRLARLTPESRKSSAARGSHAGHATAA